MDTLFKHLGLTVLLAGLLTLPGVLPASPAAAADPAVRGTASPGTLYELGTFSRRGVTIRDGGTLEIRSDGCWRTDMDVVNTGSVTRTVGISFRWFGGGGRTLATLPVASGLLIAPGETATVSTNGCSGQIARTYGALSATEAVRFMSVR